MAPQSLAGTIWTVTAINGEPTPPGMTMRFAAETLTAFFGCNRASGGYRLVGNRIETGPIAATRMACEPATDAPGAHPMQFENRGFAVLNLPLNVHWMSGNRLILSNAAGSIALQRTP